MLVDRPLDPLCAAVMVALDQSLTRAGYALLVATTVTAEESLARGRELLGRGVEALVCWTAAHVPSLEEHAAVQSVPWIVFDHPVRSAPALTASSGRRGGTLLACRYLLSLGHRRFAIVAGTDLAGEVREALATQATAIETPLVNHGEDLDGAQASVGALLDQGRATAIVSGSDLLAFGALRECAVRGVSVPGDISVVGLGDSPPARCASPPLTSIRVAAEEIGALTAEALLLLIAGGTPVAVEIAAKLVLRESTGPAPV